MPPSHLKSAVEALLFSSDQPLTLALLAEALEAPAEDVTVVLASLGEEYTAREAGVVLREIAGGWMVATAPDQHEWVARMLRGKRRMRLSRAALETMAIVAYKQPVTKSEIEAIRGVDASGVLATLLERNLVTIKGRSTLVGRPLLYGTTTEFLNYFGLRDISELPRPEELRALVAAREPEQLEMMELDPESGMPLALAAAAVVGGVVAASEGGADVAASEAETPTGIAEPEADADDEEAGFSIADADAAIAQANAARAGAVRAMQAPAPEATVHVATDLVEAGDGGDDDEDEDDDASYDDDDDDFEGDEDDEDDEDADEYDDDDDDEDEDEDGEDDEDADEDDEDADARAYELDADAADPDALGATRAQDGAGDFVEASDAPAPADDATADDAEAEDARTQPALPGDESRRG